MSLNSPQRREGEGGRGREWGGERERERERDRERSLENRTERKAGASLESTCNKPAMTAKQSY